jgi:hypothetical protein
MASGSPVQKERIDQAMSRLEKLKQEIASIESKYHILDDSIQLFVMKLWP